MAALTKKAPLKIVVFDESPQDAQRLAEAIGNLGIVCPLDVIPLSEVTKLAMELSGGVDLLFMDLGASGRSYDGVDYVRMVVRDGSMTKVIFTGGQKGAHRRIYLVDHLWYLPKPVDALELRDAMSKALHSIERDRERPFLVLSNRSDVAIHPREVRYVESRVRMLHIHGREQDVSAYGSLDDIAVRFPAKFVRCHKSYLVNLDYVRRLGADGLELVTGEVLPVSQRRRSATREAMQRHFGRFES